MLHQDSFSPTEFNSVFRASGKDHEKHPGLRRFIENLDYADAGYFTTDELRFYMRIAQSYKVLTDNQIELERQKVEREGQSGWMVKSHSEYILKAIEYWKLHFNKKFEEWRQKYAETSEAWWSRRRLRDGYITPQEATTVEDDGYSTGTDSDEDQGI